MKTDSVRRIAYCSIVLLNLVTCEVHAEVVTDGSMGPAGALSGPNYQIPANIGQQKGGNLFHSFGLFNIYKDESATFSGPNSVQNIISRVTWGQSWIDGALRSTIPNANLFLINPYGVIFGPNATLDVKGSFHVSTADYLRLGENDRFYADPAKTSVLSTAPVEAFGFLSNAPAPVWVLGSNLAVPAGKTLSVIGGDVWTSGALRAPAGRLDIAAMSGPGEVKPTATDLETAGGQPGGAIDVAGGVLSVTGDRAGSIFIRGGRFSVDGGVVGVNARGSGDGGKLDVRAQDMEVTNDGSIRSLSAQGRGADVMLLVDRLTLSNGGYIEVSSGGTGVGGNLNITANNIEIKGHGQYASGLYGYAYSSGNAGELRVSASELTVSDNGLIQSWSGTGRGADVTLKVDRLTLSNGGYIEVSSGGAGPGGNLNITANNIEMSNGGYIEVSSHDSGPGGNLNIDAKEAVEIKGSGQYRSGLYGWAYSTGDAGKLQVTAPNLTLSEGGTIQSLALVGRGADIDLAVDRLTLNNGLILANSSSTATRNAGNITIVAPIVELKNWGGIESGTAGEGNAGNLSLKVDRLLLSEGSYIATGTSGEGRGGDIQVNAAELVSIIGSNNPFIPTGLESNSSSSIAGAAGNISIITPVLEVKNNGIIQSSTDSDNNAGRIELNVDRLIVTQGSLIASETSGTKGNGGEILINAGKSVTIAGQNILGMPAGISVNSYAPGAGEGRKIQINAPLIEVNEGGTIQSATTGNGNAGKIELNVDRLALTGGGQIRSSTGGENIFGRFSGSGQGGTVNVNAREVVSIEGKASTGQPSAIFASSEAPATGSAGKISIVAPLVQLSGGGVIQSTTDGAGNAGTIELHVDRLIINQGSNINTSTAGGKGLGGDIDINAKKSVTISGKFFTGLAANSQAPATGDAGVIKITTPLVELNDSGAILSATNGIGNAGTIELDVDRLVLQEGGYLGALTVGPGQGGAILVKAADSVTIAGKAANGAPSGLTADSRFAAKGSAGSIQITTPFLEIKDGSTIGSSTEGEGNAGTIRLDVGRFSLTGGAQVATATMGSGQGGAIRVNAAEAVSISGIDETNLSAGPFAVASGLFTSSFAANGGQAGSIQVIAPEVELDNLGAIQSSTMGSRNAGAIELTVDRLILNNGGNIATDTRSGSGQGGVIHINARESISIAGRDLITGVPSGLSASSGRSATGKAGAITITAPLLKVSDGSHIASATWGNSDAGTVSLEIDRLELHSGGSISTDTYGSGHGGDITVKAKMISVSDAGSSLSAATSGTGNAGTIAVEAGRLELSEGGYISTDTFGSGRSGDITVTAKETVTAFSQGDPAAASGLFASAGESATGKGGNIVVTAPLIDLERGGFIESATYGAGDAGTVILSVDRLIVNQGGVSTSTEGTGQGGDITVTARESISLTGRSDFPDVPFGLQASSNKPTSGNAGNIVVTTPELTVSQGSEISSATQGRGNAGTVTLQVDRLTLSQGGQISTSTLGGTGSGGNIDINAADSITLSGKSESQSSGLYARSRAPASGNAGNITLTTDRLVLNPGTTVTAESEQSSGGNILINARDTRLYNNSTLSSSVQGNEQSDGGNVTLNGDILLVYGGGKITARANQGRGGRITINENVFLYEGPRAIPDVLDASSQVAGNQGVVTVSAPELNVSGVLTALPAAYLDASKLLSNRCAAPQEGSRSSFVVRGRGTVSPGPEGAVPAAARECLPAATDATTPVLPPAPVVEGGSSNRRFDF